MYILKNTPLPPGGGGISANVTLGKKYEKAKRKRGKIKKEQRGKKKGSKRVK
jgi:hypothetical protein